MIIYQCSYCHDLSQDEKYKGDNTRCPKCQKGYMRKYNTDRNKKPEQEKQPPRRCELVCCVSCGRDTSSKNGICHLCTPMSKNKYRADAESKGRKNIKINNARSGEGLGCFDTE